MKRVTFEQVIAASQRLQGDRFTLQITSPSRPLQTTHTENILVNMSFLHGSKQDRVLRIMARYGTFFRKAWLYVKDEDFIKYF